MKNGSSVEMNKWSQTVELIKFEPVTLARLDGIPTPAHGNEELFVLFDKKLLHCHFMKFDCIFCIAIS